MELYPKHLPSSVQTRFFNEITLTCKSACFRGRKGTSISKAHGRCKLLLTRKGDQTSPHLLHAILLLQFHVVVGGLYMNANRAVACDWFAF